MSQSLQRLYEAVDEYYSKQTAAEWAYRNWMIPVIACVIYLVLVQLGRRLMRDRPPYKLRGVLTIWNVCLAVFSVLGLVAMAPNLISAVRDGGFAYSVCFTEIHYNSWLAFWSTLFCVSKVIEFGDTFFIIVRKTPLQFLHWYHHVTVCLYSWQSLALWSAPAHWFCAMNFAVHSVMYSYYVLKSSRVPMPSFVAPAITLLQLVQFVVGLAVITTATFHYLSGNTCHVSQSVIVCGLIIYGSYLVLFADFFMKRHCSAKRSPSTKKDE